MTLHVLAKFTAHADSIGALREILIRLVAPIRKDPGCISCVLVENQATPAEMIFVEEWQSEVALDRHLADPAIGELVAEAAPHLAAPFVLARFSPLG